MDLYFGKIKTKKYIPYQYRYTNYREYLEAQHNHIRHLEATIETLSQDILLLDNRLKIQNRTENKIVE